MRKLFLFLLLVLAMVSCKDDPKEDIIGPIPEAPNYADDNLWYSNLVDGAKYDVLYFVPTCTQAEVDPATGEMTYFANVANSDTQRAVMLSQMKVGQDIFGTEANFYSPYYRQVTAESLVSDEVLFGRFYAVSEGDVRDAFDYYLKNINDGRPFVLAGYSQGSMSVMAVMEVMPDEALPRMIASYAVGINVTAKDRADIKCLIPATGESDLGVTISYNSVADPSDLPSFLQAPTVCINPVNWSTTDAPAEFVAPKGDNATVHVDQDDSVLIIEGLNPLDYTSTLGTDIFPVGCFHVGELSFYEDYLRENVKHRASIFLGDTAQ